MQSREEDRADNEAKAGGAISGDGGVDILDDRDLRTLIESFNAQCRVEGRLWFLPLDKGHPWGNAMVVDQKWSPEQVNSSSPPIEPFATSSLDLRCVVVQMWFKIGGPTASGSYLFNQKEYLQPLCPKAPQFVILSLLRDVPQLLVIPSSLIHYPDFRWDETKKAEPYARVSQEVRSYDMFLPSASTETRANDPFSLCTSNLIQSNHLKNNTEDEPGAIFVSYQDYGANQKKKSSKRFSREGRREMPSPLMSLEHTSRRWLSIGRCHLKLSTGSRSGVTPTPPSFSLNSFKVDFALALPEICLCLLPLALLAVLKIYL
jgi:hypothetical protein